MCVGNIVDDEMAEITGYLNHQDNFPVLHEEPMVYLGTKLIEAEWRIYASVN